MPRGRKKAKVKTPAEMSEADNLRRLRGAINRTSRRFNKENERLERPALEDALFFTCDVCLRVITAFHFRGTKSGRDVCNLCRHVAEQNGGVVTTAPSSEIEEGFADFSDDPLYFMGQIKAIPAIHLHPACVGHIDENEIFVDDQNAMDARFDFAYDPSRRTRRGKRRVVQSRKQTRPREEGEAVVGRNEEQEVIESQETTEPHEQKASDDTASVSPAPPNQRPRKEKKRVQFVEPLVTCVWEDIVPSVGRLRAGDGNDEPLLPPREVRDESPASSSEGESSTEENSRWLPGRDILGWAREVEPHLRAGLPTVSGEIQTDEGPSEENMSEEDQLLRFFCRFDPGHELTPTHADVKEPKVDEHGRVHLELGTCAPFLWGNGPADQCTSSHACWVQEVGWRVKQVVIVPSRPSEGFRVMAVASVKNGQSRIELWRRTVLKRDETEVSFDRLLSIDTTRYGFQTMGWLPLPWRDSSSSPLGFLTFAGNAGVLYSTAIPFVLWDEQPRDVLVNVQLRRCDVYSSMAHRIDDQAPKQKEAVPLAIDTPEYQELIRMQLLDGTRKTKTHDAIAHIQWLYDGHSEALLVVHWARGPIALLRPDTTTSESLSLVRVGYHVPTHDKIIPLGMLFRPFAASIDENRRLRILQGFSRDEEDAVRHVDANRLANISTDLIGDNEERNRFLEVPADAGVQILGMPGKQNDRLQVKMNAYATKKHVDVTAVGFHGAGICFAFTTRNAAQPISDRLLYPPVRRSFLNTAFSGKRKGRSIEIPAVATGLVSLDDDFVAVANAKQFIYVPTSDDCRDDPFIMAELSRYWGSRVMDNVHETPMIQSEDVAGHYMMAVPELTTWGAPRCRMVREGEFPFIAWFEDGLVVRRHCKPPAILDGSVLWNPEPRSRAQQTPS